MENHSKSWTLHDIELLKTYYYDGISCRDIAGILGRTEQAIKQQVIDRKLSTTRGRSQMIRNYLKGRPHAKNKELMQLFGISRESCTYYRKCMELKLATDNGNQKVTEGEVELWQKFRNAGWSYEKISRATNYSMTTVWKYLQKGEL